jgi:hypothetical protein
MLEEGGVSILFLMEGRKRFGHKGLMRAEEKIYFYTDE